MAKGKRDGILIAGGGLAGSLAALALARKRPEVPLLLVEESDRFGGDQTWLFHDDDLNEADRWLIDPLNPVHWDGYYVSFPGQSRRFKAGINAIRSSDVDSAVREILRPDQYRTGTKVVAVRDNELVLLGGEKIKADGAIDARGAANLSMLSLGWRKSTGQDVEFAEPHKVDRPVIADATVEQLDGFRFFQCIPFSETRMLVEDCRLSNSSELDPKADEQIESYLKLRGWKKKEVLREQHAALPIALGGDFGAFWRVGGARVAKLGLRGGFFHPSNGHTFADAVRNAALLSEQRDFSGAALHDLFEERAATLWRKREPYRGFNAGVFAGKPEERRRIFDGFYQLEPAFISRFHAADLGMLDRMKLSKLGK